MSAARKAAPQPAPEELEAKLIAPDELRLPDLGGLIDGRPRYGLPVATSKPSTSTLPTCAWPKRDHPALPLRRGRAAMDSKAPEGSSHAALRRREMSLLLPGPCLRAVPSARTGRPSADRPHAHRDPPSRRAAARRDHRRQGHRQRRARTADGRLPRGRRALKSASNGEPAAACCESGRSSAQEQLVHRLQNQACEARAALLQSCPAPATASDLEHLGLDRRAAADRRRAARPGQPPPPFWPPG